MSKGSAASPQTVDPNALASAQTSSNIATAQSQAALNNANTYSPFGSSIWTPNYNSTTGQTSYSLNQSLSPQLQQLFGTQTGLAQQLAGVGSNIPAYGGSLLGQAGAAAGAIPTNLNLSGVAPITQLTPGSFQTNVAQGPVQTSVNSNFPQLIQQAQNAAYQSQTQYLDPQFSQSQSNLQQQLADQGIEEGTPAYSRAMLDFNNQKQQAYQSAQDQAVSAGNAQEQSLFGQSLGAGQFANQAQQQMFGQGLNLADLYNQAVLGAAGQQNTATSLGLQEAQAQANQPLAAFQALNSAGLGSLGTAAGLTNVAPTWPLSIPTYGGEPTTVQPTNYAGLQQAANQGNALAYQGAQANLAGLGTLGSQALFGSGGMGNMFGTSGLLGGLFSGGSNATEAAQIASMWGGGGEADVAAGLGGGGGILSGLGSLLGLA